MMTFSLPQAVAMHEFFASATRGLVDAQQALDDDARQRMKAWEEDGIPPHAWAISLCTLAFPVPLECSPKNGVTQSTSLWLQPGPGAQARAWLAVTIRYRPTPIEED
jgi:hypothetical protein